MMGNHLLKYCHFLEDIKGHRMELRFLRDTDKREIDFVVLQNKKPVFAVECKVGEKNLSPHIFLILSLEQIFQNFIKCI